MLLPVCGTPEHEMISVSGAVLAVCSSSAKSSQATTIARTRANLCASSKGAVLILRCRGSNPPAHPESLGEFACDAEVRILPPQPASQSLTHMESGRARLCLQSRRFRDVRVTPDGRRRGTPMGLPSIMTPTALLAVIASNRMNPSSET
jgi:hypothetical protein